MVNPWFSNLMKGVTPLMLLRRPRSRLAQGMGWPRCWLVDPHLFLPGARRGCACFCVLDLLCVRPHRALNAGGKWR